MKKKYIAFHKPFGYLSQFTSDTGQKTLSEFNLPAGVYAVGRLDKDSEGLLLLSNDGPFKNRLLSPKSNHRKVYLAQVEGIPTNEQLQLLEIGVVIKGYKTKPCSIQLLSDPPPFPPRNPPIRERKTVPTSWLKIELTEGKNRQVRRMTAKIGFPTLRLVRISIAGLSLLGLSPGEWRYVRKNEIIKM